VSASADVRELPSPPTGKAPPLTVIAEGTQVEGLVHVTGDLRVDGRVEGRLLASGAACEISRAGSVAVDMARAVSIVVHGTLRATEIVARRVTVTATGVLQAQVLAAESVEVELGGALDATLEVGGG
jgi:cytoskeletal protein CcmA (bactofilin family)